MSHNMEQKQKNNSNKTELHKLIIRFLEYCEIEKNRSKLTLQAYDHYLERFGDFAVNNGVTRVDQITLEIVRNYRLHLNRIIDKNGRGLKLVSQNYHVIALRAFLKYLLKYDYKTLAPEKIELAKSPSRMVEHLEYDEVIRLIEATEQEPEDILRLRDRAVLETLFATGVRVSELCSLRREQINIQRKEFTVRGKGDKLRLVFLSPNAADALEEYFKARGDNAKWVFIAHKQIGTGNEITKEMASFGTNSKGLTPRTVQRIIKKYCLIAGITRKITPHTLRHSFATDLLQNGADIRSVQSMLGHASITTTQVYTHVTNQQLRDIHQKFHRKK